MGKPDTFITSSQDSQRMDKMRVTMDNIRDISRNIRQEFTQMTRQIAGFATRQLIEPLEGIKGVVQQLADIDLTSLMRYSSILSTIASTTKSLASENLS